jgi:proton-coupled amino acid transporter
MLVMVCALIGWGGAGDLDKFVSLVGSFACVPLVYVYPVSSVCPFRPCSYSPVLLVFANIHFQPLLHLKACATTRFQRIADISLAVMGMICCIYTTALTIYNWVGVPAPPSSPGYCDV